MKLSRQMFACPRPALRNLRSPFRPFGSFSRHAAFSLVEVTLALGLVTFAIVAVTGVIPVGLATIRNAGERITEANIVRELSGEALRTKFSGLSDFCQSGPYFFDRDGETTDAARAHFRVDLSLSNPILPVSPGFDVSTIPPMTESVKVLRFQVIRRPFAGPEGQELNSYAVHLANSGP